MYSMKMLEKAVFEETGKEFHFEQEHDDCLFPENVYDFRFFARFSPNSKTFPKQENKKQD